MTTSAPNAIRLGLGPNLAHFSLLAGVNADLLGVDAAIWLVAAVTFASGVVLPA